jgi:hypothetical protein
VKSQSDIFLGVMHDAGTDGEAAEPKALLNALSDIENPLMALVDFNQANALFEAFYSEYEFLRGLGLPTSFGPEERFRWAALLRWLVRELRAWRASADPASRKLAAMFVVAQLNDAGGVFWQLVPEDIGRNNELVGFLKALVGSFSTGIAIRGDAPAPISGQEAVEAFQVADRAGDWVEIGGRLRSLEHQLTPSIILVQSVRCLYHCGISHLVDATANLRQTIIALQIASSLRADQRLGLAAISNNPYIEFAGVYQTVSIRRAAEQLSPTHEQMLSRVLLKVALDEPRWLAWMKLFNSYPVRYPALQAALGAALAEAGDAAIDAYVNSIILTVIPIKSVMPNSNRQCIASCLRRFRASASSSKRTALWSKAHDRWSSWGFDRENPQTYLFNVGRCGLDYALVGFAAECMNDIDRGEANKAILATLSMLENDWYVSLTDVISQFHRILSKFQPYAHAASVQGSGEDWLTDARVYYPFVPGDNKYFVMKYRLDFAG